MRLSIVLILIIIGSLLLTQGCAQKGNGQTVIQQNSADERGKPLLQEQEETCAHNEITGLAVSPDGLQILTVSPMLGLRLFDLESGRLIRRFGDDPQSLIGSVAFSPDGHRALSYGYGVPIHVWEVASGQEIFHVAGNKHGTTRAVFTPDGQRIISCDLEGGTIHLWDAQNGQEVDSLKVAGEDANLDAGFSQDSRRALIISSGGETACLWDLERKLKLRCSTARDTQVEISRDGSYGIFSRGDQVLRFLDIGSGREIPVPKTLKGATIESLSKDARRILFSRDEEGEFKLHLAESSSGREVYRLKADEDETVFPALFTPDERYAVAGNSIGGLCLWDLQNGKRIRCFGKEDVTTSHHRM